MSQQWSAKERVIAVNKKIVELGRERRLAEALAQLDGLAAQRLKPTAVTFNVLITAAGRCGDNSCAADLLSRMHTHGLKPNVITYASVLKGLCLSGDIDKAHDLLADAEAAGVPPNERIATAFLRGCMVWGECEHVVPFCTRMASKWGLVLDATAIDYAGRALSMGLLVEEAEELQKQLQHPQPSAAFSIAMAEACAVLHQNERADTHISHAERRVASGVEARLHADRDEMEGYGEQLQSFLHHRAEETKREMHRIKAIINVATAASAPKKRSSKKKRLKALRRVYGRFVLLSDSTRRLATSPLAAKSSSAVHGMPPNRLRRWKLGALLIARLERLGLGRLIRSHAGGDDVAAQLCEKRLITHAKKACNSKCEVRWDLLFGNAQPIVLEVCAGDGEWALGQAARQPEINWIASELRGDRIHQIASRLRALDAPNLALLGGDAALALAHHTRKHSFDAIYVNFPEPPSDHGNADEYLINAAFLTNCHRALRPDGHGLLIVSDNPILLETVATTLGGLMAGSDGGRALSFATARPGPLVVEGVPHGFGAEGTSSYFDRLWQSRAKQRRYHIHVIKK